MTLTALHSPVAGLHALANETRVLATPWSRMVRGIGLGQHPIPFDEQADGQIRRALDLLAAKGVEDGGGYARFARLLTEFILDAAGTPDPVPGPRIAARLGPILDAARTERNAYFRVMAGCVLADAFAKLRLDRAALLGGAADLPGELLAQLDTIEPDRIRDENAGRHGQYERLSAATAVLLALGQLGLRDELTGDGARDGRDRVHEALALLEQVPSPFFRGRGGATLLSAVLLLGCEPQLRAEGRDHIEQVLDHLDRAGGLPQLAPAFPQPMSPAFAEVYPLLTMLNAISMTSRPEHYLDYRRDRLAQARELMGRLRPIERTHMGLYYIMALHNLGRLADQLPDFDSAVERLVRQWEDIDPGENYFLNGIAYPYLIQTAMLTGRMDLISERTLDRMIDGFPDLDRTEDDRRNRPYPFAYAFNVLAEIGRCGLLFEPRPAYGGAAPIEWVVARLSPGGREEPRLYMLYHALLSFALRLRGPQRGQTPLFEQFRPAGRASW